MNEFDKYQKFIKDAKLALLFLLALIIVRSTIVEPFRIPSGSMLPTLYVGDYILVNKFSYGLKIPFSDLSLGDTVNLSPIFIWGKKDPERGDVVVFKYPKEPSVNYIKRVIGIPGDTLEIVDKKIIINGKQIIEKEIDGKEFLNEMDEKFKDYKFKFFQNSLGQAVHLTQINTENFFKTDFPKTTIPAGKFFMMGDNRDHSYDSRFWGFVSREEIKGKAFVVWMSFTFPFSESKGHFRFNRLFHQIR